MSRDRIVGWCIACVLVGAWAGLRWSTSQTPVPYPATYWLCDAPSVEGRAEFMPQCMETVEMRFLDQAARETWCQEMARGIYCQPEPGFRYSQVSAGVASQGAVRPCSAASSEEERAVCGTREQETVKESVK